MNVKFAELTLCAVENDTRSRPGRSSDRKRSRERDAEILFADQRLFQMKSHCPRVIRILRFRPVSQRFAGDGFHFQPFRQCERETENVRSGNFRRQIHDKCDLVLIEDNAVFRADAQVRFDLGKCDIDERIVNDGTEGATQRNGFAVGCRPAEQHRRKLFFVDDDQLRRQHFIDLQFVSRCNPDGLDAVFAVQNIRRGKGEHFPEFERSLGINRNFDGLGLFGIEEHSQHLVAAEIPTADRIAFDAGNRERLGDANLNFVKFALNRNQLEQMKTLDGAGGGDIKIGVFGKKLEAFPASIALPRFPENTSLFLRFENDLPGLQSPVGRINRKRDFAFGAQTAVRTGDGNGNDIGSGIPRRQSHSAGITAQSQFIREAGGESSRAIQNNLINDSVFAAAALKAHRSIRRDFAKVRKYRRGRE